MGRYAIFNGLVYGGGTEVIPNPEGTPTEELHSIQIDEDIYEIVGGGGSGEGYSETLLYKYTSGTTIDGIKTLNDDITNYDLLLFRLVFNVPTYTDHIISVSALEQVGYISNPVATGPHVSIVSYASDYIRIVEGETKNKINIFEINGNEYIDEIYGIKLEGGSGSGGNASLDATTLYDTPITSTGTYTLADDYNNYDFIGFKAGNGSTETDIRLYAVKDIQDSMNDNLVITNNVTNSWFNFTINENELTIPGKTVSTIYSVIGYKIKGGGGGSTVVPNPEEEPTDTLNTIEIDGIVYNIEGGSEGGQGYTETILWSGSETTNKWVEPIVLNNVNVDEYDALAIQVNVSQHIVSTEQIPVGDASASSFIGVNGFLNTNGESVVSIWLNKGNNLLRIFTATNVTIVVTKVVGIKYGSGGGGTSEGEGVEIYSEDEYIVGKWIDGKKLYQKSIKFSATSLPASWTTIEQNVDYNLVFPEAQCLYYTANGEPFTQSTRVFVQNGELKIQPLKELDLLSSTLKHVITIRYTKTVETPAPAWGGSVNNYYASFIDTDNVIYSTVSSSASDTYTATEDCYIMQDIVVGTNVATVQIDGKTVAEYSFSGTQLLSYNAYLKKGQTITVAHGATSAHTIKVFGVSYSSGGSESRNPKIEYSTDEKEVGTWIDGSKVYELTIFNDNLTDTSTVSNAMYIGSIPNNANIVTELSVSVCDSNHAGWVTGGGICTVNGWNFGLHITEGKVVLYGGNVSAIQGGMAIAKIRYTKTTT